MLTPGRALEYYFAVIIVVGGLCTLIGIKYTLRRWRSFPQTGWLGRSFGTGLLALVLSSFIEAPFLFVPVKTLLAFGAGTTEEIMKLLPLKLFRDAEEWEKWKLVVGAAFFLGLLEAIGYIGGIILLKQPLYLIGVRLVLIGMHTVWAVITVGFLLTEGGLSRFKGLAFSIVAHTLYDVPPLALADGASGEVILGLSALSTLFILLTPIMAKKSTEKAASLIPIEEETEEETGEEETEGITSSP